MGKVQQPQGKTDRMYELDQAKTLVCADRDTSRLLNEDTVLRQGFKLPSGVLHQLDTADRCAHSSLGPTSGYKGAEPVVVPFGRALANGRR